MKKTMIYALLLVGFGFSAKAQFKPEAGTITTEMQFRPFGNNPLGIEGVSVRYFLQDKFAVRVNLNYEMSNDKTYNAPLNTPEEIISQKQSAFEIAPAIEYHFGEIDRLSPYVGAGLGIGFGSSLQHNENWNHVSGDYRKVSNSSFSFRLGLVAGFDFYVYQGLYLGGEFAFGYATNNTGKSKSETSLNGTVTTVDGTVTTKNPTIGFQAVPAIRLGWKF